MRRLLLASLLAMVLSTVGRAETASLAGSEWGFRQERGGEQRFVQFGSDGVLAGWGGCNRFSGRYELAGDALEIRGIVSTMRGCADEVMRRERELLDALAAARRLEASHLVLKVYGADGRLLLDLVRRDFD